jgi:hypothetical protein
LGRIPSGLRSAGRFERGRSGQPRAEISSVSMPVNLSRRVLGVMPRRVHRPVMTTADHFSIPIKIPCHTATSISLSFPKSRRLSKHAGAGAV